MIIIPKLGLALFACFGGCHIGRWETAVLHLCWPTVQLTETVSVAGKQVEAVSEMPGCRS